MLQRKIFVKINDYKHHNKINTTYISCKAIKYELTRRIIETEHEYEYTLCSETFRAKKTANIKKSCTG